MSKFLFILLFFWNVANATDQGVVIYHPSQTSDRVSYDFDLNKLQIIKKDEFNFEEYNKQNLYEYMIGGQVVQYEQKIGTLIQEFSPVMELRHRYYSNDNIVLDFNGAINKNSFNLSEKIEPSVHFNKTHLFVIGEFGQEIAVQNQKDSGFLYLNYGLGVRQFIGSWSIDMQGSKPIKSIDKEINLQSNIIRYSENKKYFGIAIYSKQLIPFNQKYSNDKYSISGLSLFFGF